MYGIGVWYVLRTELDGGMQGKRDTGGCRGWVLMAWGKDGQKRWGCRVKGH